MECENVERCAGQGPGVLAELQQAADKGPLTEENLRQAAKLLTSNRASPTLLCATLSLLKSSLGTHLEADPRGLHSQLVSAGLIPALATLLTPPLASANPTPHADPRQLLLADSIGALLNTLLAPAIQALATKQQPTIDCKSLLASAFGKAKQGQHPPLAEQLLSHALPLLRAADGLAYRQAAAEAALQLLNATCWPSGAIQEGPERLTLRHQGTGGAAALLAVGSMVALRQGLRLDGPPLVSMYGLAPSASVLHLKLVLLLERDMPHRRMPDAGLATLLLAVLQDGQGAFCQSLLRSTAGLATLARPLQALAGNVTACVKGAYQHHVEAMCKVFEWTASVAGLQGIGVLASTMAPPAVEVLDGLLALDPVKHAGVAPMLEGVLATLLHAATTTVGKKVIVQAGQISRWLRRAVAWHSTSSNVSTQLPQVLNMLMLDYSRAPYPYPLYRSGTWQSAVAAAESAQPEQSSRQLDNQLATQTALESLVILLQLHTDDTVVKCRLVTMITRAIRLPDQPVSKLPDFEGVMTRILEAVRPPAATKQRGPPSSQARNLPHHQQQLLQWMVGCQFALKAAIPLVEGHASAGGACGSAVASVVLEWLEVAPATSGTSPDGWQSDRPALSLLLGNLLLLLDHDLLDLELFLAQGAVSHVAALLPRLGTEERRAAFTLLYAALAAEPDPATSFSSQMASALEAPAVLAAVLQYVREAARAQAASGLAGPSAGGFVSQTLEEDVSHAVTLLNAALPSWHWQGGPAACLQVLEAAELWELVNDFMRLGRRQGDDEAGAAWCRFLLEALLRHPGTDVAALAGVRLRDMGETSVQVAMRGAPPSAQELVQAAVAAAGSSGRRISSRTTTTQPTTSSSSSGRSGRSGQDTAAASNPRTAAAAGRPSSATTTAAATAAATGTTTQSTGSEAAGRGRGGATVSSNAGGSSSGPGLQTAAATGIGGTPSTKASQKHSSNAWNAASGKPSKSSAAASPGAPQTAVSSSSNIVSNTAMSQAGPGAAAASSSGSGRACSVCHTQPEQSFLCSRCKSVRYCSAGCQQADWKAHKKVCRQLQSALPAGHSAAAAAAAAGD